jgi:hypothetical protein
MPVPSVILDEVLPHLASHGIHQDDEPRMEPLLDPGSGEEDGILLEAGFGRMVVVRRDEPVLSLRGVSHVRQMMVRARARRALLYVPLQTVVTNPVMLLATLSHIEIVRLAPAGPDTVASH